MKIDIDRPLEQVRQGWVRKPVVVFLFIALLPIVILVDLVASPLITINEALNDFFIPCWKGPKNE